MLITSSRLVRFTLSLCVMVSIFSCGPALQKSIQDDGKQIPPEYGKEETTLLVVRHGKRGYDKYLEQHFKENYTGKYIIVDKAEINLEKYDDQKIYRYVFDEDHHVKGVRDTKGRPQPGVRPTSHDMSRELSDRVSYFQVSDRVTGKIYKTNKASGQFGKLMKYYIQALEATRLKNKA